MASEERVDLQVVQDGRIRGSGRPVLWPTPRGEKGDRPWGFETHAVAKEQFFDHIEVFYNQQRRPSAFGYVSPAEFERANRSAGPEQAHQ